MRLVAVILLVALAASAASMPTLEPRHWQETPDRTSHGSSDAELFSSRVVQLESGEPQNAVTTRDAPPSSRILTTRNGPSPVSTLTSRLQGGLTMDSCKTSRDCLGSRECKVGFMDEPSRCTEEDNDNCRCQLKPPLICDDSEDCVAGEVCARFYTEAGFFCASEAAVEEYSTLTEIGEETIEPTSEEEEGEGQPTEEGQASAVKELPSNICIAVHALRNFNPEELVFEQHALAGVLCDGNGSCATPGHMVLVQGKAMMMKSYCDMVPCERRVMHVNSPRHRRGMLIESNTEGLAFTAFAARYETKSEEAIIAVAVRFGL